MSVEALFEQVKALPIAQRVEFAQRLWDDVTESAGDEPSSEECALIDRRLEEHLENPDAAVPWEVVKARLDAKYNR